MKKDLGIKIGTKEEKFWTGVKEKAEEDSLSALRQVEINGIIIKYCIKRIEEEKERFK